MTMNELKTQLMKSHVPEDVYSLIGGKPNEAYCLNHCSGRWEAYYSERGIKSNKKEFITEDEACNYFYNWITQSLRNVGIL